MATTAQKAPKFLTMLVDEEAGSIIGTFADGQSVRLDVSELGEAVKRSAMLLGLTNKLRDTAANFSKDNDVDGAFDAMRATCDALVAGEWNRSGGGSAGVKMKDLASAISEVQNATFEKAFAVVQRASAEQRAMWAKNGKIAAVIARIVAERLNAKAAAATDEDGLPTFDAE